MRTRAIQLGILVCAGLFAACQKEFDQSTLPRGQDTNLDTSYVELYPPFPGIIRGSSPAASSSASRSRARSRRGRS